VIKHSTKVDADQAQLSLDGALSMGGDLYQNIQAAIDDNEVKINARGVYGANAPDVFKGAISAALGHALHNGLADPQKAPTVIKMMQDPAVKEKLLGYLTPEGKGAVLSALKSSYGEVALNDGMALGTEIFKADTSGSIESMTDRVRSSVKERGFSAETERAAVTQIKELYSERRTDEAKRASDAKDRVNAILNPIALKRNGINRVSDLSPSQWSELERDNPEYAKQLQDNMRRELDYQIHQGRQDAAIYRQERVIEQSENEQLLLLSDDFRKHDLKSELATGKISTVQYNRLTKLQESMDPIKRESVKAALSKVNTGGGLAAALGGLNKNEESLWKLKYSDVIKAFAENNIDDPNFDTKLTEFVEKYIFSDMTTSFFALDSTDRISKYTTALKEADPLRNDAIAALTKARLPITERNIRFHISRMKGQK
jgi:hypothetical protein